MLRLTLLGRSIVDSILDAWQPTETRLRVGRAAASPRTTDDISNPEI
jgi:hypothetical protein